MIDTPDPFNRPPVTEPIKSAIREAFSVVPEGKSSAVLAIFDRNGARLHVAWRVTDEDSKFGEWKVGAVVGIPKNHRPDGSVFVEASW